MSISENKFLLGVYLERVFFAKSAINYTFDTSERADKTYNKS